MNWIGAALCTDPGRAQAEASRLSDRFVQAGHEAPSVWIGEGAALLVSTVAGSKATARIARCDRYCVVGDVRLDDGPALAATLCLPADAAPADLIRAAYARWKDACCERLRGAFAFIVFDRAERCLFAARDRFGIRPLYVREAAGVVRLASSSRVLSSGRRSDRFVAGFLAGLVEDEIQTVDPDVTRLPAAHSLVCGLGASSVQRRYWSLAAAEAPPADQVVDAFRERFTTAVQRCLGDGALGVLLSGGIDSTSIAGVAAGLWREAEPLRSFSMVFPEDPRSDESRYIDLVVEARSLRSHKLNGSQVPPLAGFDRLAHPGPPSFAEGVGSGRSRALFAFARAQGAEVLLDGHGGDEVVWNGYRRVLDLAEQGRWIRALAQVPGMAKVSGEEPLLLAASILSAARGPVGRLSRPWARLYRSRSRTSPRPMFDELDHISAALRRSTDLDDRVAAARTQMRAALTDSEAHATTLSSPRIAYGFESLRRMAEAEKVELRFPFFDTELVAFCLGLPSEEKLRAGWPRSVMRRAMGSHVPDAVRWRRDKTDFGPSISRGLAYWHSSILQDLSRDRDGRLAQYYRMDRVRTVVSRILEAPDRVSTPDAVIVWKAAYLHLALGETGGENGRGP